MSVDDSVGPAATYAYTHFPRSETEAQSSLRRSPLPTRMFDAERLQTTVAPADTW